MTAAALVAGLRRPPDPPELPEAARPRWPPWYAPVGLIGAFIAVVFAVIPLVPGLLLSGRSEDLDALVLLALLLVQDGTFVGAALLFAGFKARPRAWHFGLRAVRFRRAAVVTVLATLFMFGFEIGYIELLGVDEGNAEDLGGEGSVVAGFAVAVALILVAPVTEEFFFRAFFYRALRSRLRVWSAALIDGVVFGSLHFQGLNSVEILPVIAVFGIGVCLVYEVTGSLFTVIAIHAAFNTLASAASGPGLPISLAVGLTVIAACIAVPRKLGPGPSPFGADPRGQKA